MDPRIVFSGLLIAVATCLVVPTAANADSCNASANAAAGKNAYFVHVRSAACGGASSGDPGGDNSTASISEPKEVWVWRPICETNKTGETGGLGLCTNLMKCPKGETLMRHWRIKPPPEIETGITCMPLSAAKKKPTITPGMVLTAFRQVPLPHPVARTQPEDTTLVNFDTIFYTEAGPLTRTVTLLGQQVRLQIKPDSFRWVHGDGTATTTSTPGAPYPAKTIVHRYPDAHVTVAEHVEVTWSATYSVNGGPSQPVPGTVTTVGPDQQLQIAEAVPALSGAGH